MFSARLINQKDVNMLNICDSDILGKILTRDKFTLKITENFYGKNNIEKEEAKELLKKCNSINMVGKEIISLSVDMGIGSEKGVKLAKNIKENHILQGAFYNYLLAIPPDLE